MRADDHDDDAPEGTGPASNRPSPFDRPWIHPSELSPFVASPPTFGRQPSTREWTIGASSAVVGVVVTVLALVAFGALGSRNPGPTFISDSTSPSGFADQFAVARIAASTARSIVTIRVSDTVSVSGVAVSRERIVTDALAVQGASSVSVVTTDRRSLTAAVLGTDPDSGVALLRADGGNLQPAQLASGDTLRIGQIVIGVSTQGANPWTSVGVVSARNVLLKAADNRITMAGLLETDVKTAPEHTGGALVDFDGNVIGLLVTAPGDARTGLAVPADVLGDVMDQLATTGKAQHGWLGVAAVDAIDRPSGGATVTAVAPNSPAVKAGLFAGDVIGAIDNRTLGGFGDLVASVRIRKPGDSFDLTVWRGGSSRKVTVKLEPPAGGDPATGWPRTFG